MADDDNGANFDRIPMVHLELPTAVLSPFSVRGDRFFVGLKVGEGDSLEVRLPGAFSASLAVRFCCGGSELPERALRGKGALVRKELARSREDVGKAWDKLIDVIVAHLRISRDRSLHQLEEEDEQEAQRFDTEVD